jgi:hypothetical protein
MESHANLSPNLSQEHLMLKHALALVKSRRWGEARSILRSSVYPLEDAVASPGLGGEGEGAKERSDAACLLRYMLSCMDGFIFCL